MFLATHHALRKLRDVPHDGRRVSICLGFKTSISAAVVEPSNSDILLPRKNSEKNLQKHWQNAFFPLGFLTQFDSLFRNGFPRVERPSR